MSRLGWVEVGEYTVAAGKFGGRHVSPGEQVFLFDFGDIKEYGKALAVKEHDDLWVAADERTRWHVGTEHRRLEFLNTGPEELVSATGAIEILNRSLIGWIKGMP